MNGSLKCCDSFLVCLGGWAKNQEVRMGTSCKANSKCILRRGKGGAFMQADRAIICQLFTQVFFYSDIEIFAAARRHSDIF